MKPQDIITFKVDETFDDGQAWGMAVEYEGRMHSWYVRLLPKHLRTEDHIFDVSVDSGRMQ